MINKLALMLLDVFDFFHKKKIINFLKRKTLDEIVYQKVGFLSNFTRIYVGKQTSKVLTKIKKKLKKFMN